MAGGGPAHRGATSILGRAVVTGRRRRRWPASVYVDTADWWIGYYRGDRHHYVCLLPCIVISWPRRQPSTAELLDRWARAVDAAKDDWPA